ncbi:MAG: DUF4177 domain-containing protein [Myxococcales bacterium]|nr:DUF4177 domain-containing protein [Myxococcales bacterium]
MYRVVELTQVTDDAIEAELNQWAREGYALEGMHFAMREGSRRPSMAFLVFVRSGGLLSPSAQ